MKEFLNSVIISKLLTLIALIISGILAYYDIDGWGWFLFAALVLANKI